MAVKDRLAILYSRVQEDAINAKRLREEARIASESRDEFAMKAALAEDAGKILVKIADLKRSEVSTRVEGIVTKALHAVFDRSDIAFKFRWEEKRGTMTATPVIVTTYQGEPMEVDILDGHGGGIVDVVAFVLRFVLARLTPGLLPLLVVDEPFRHVSAGHADGIGKMLTLLGARSGWRFLLITHQHAIAERADHVYSVTQENGITHLTEEERSIE